MMNPVQVPINFVQHHENASQTPNKDRFFAHLRSVISNYNAEGYQLIRGMEEDEDDEDDEDEEDEGNENEMDDDKKGEGQMKKKNDYPEENFQAMRLVLLTKNRERFYKKGLDFVAPKDESGADVMFDTQRGNAIIAGMKKKITNAMNCKELPGRFDALYGLTVALNAHDAWLNDNDSWTQCPPDKKPLDAAIIKLGSAWRELLQHSDRELGIDPDFTRPGVECLLSEFAKCATNCQYLSFPFEWN